jgi:short-subunit dehydrogenase
MRELRGKCVLITGGSLGLGFEIARACLAAGMRVALASRSQANLEQARIRLVADSSQLVSFPTDIRQVSQLMTLVSDVERAFGSIDILINNAGIETYRRFEELVDDEIQETIQTNLIAAIQLSRWVIPGMLRRGIGHIVNMSSTAGKHGPAFGAAYGASKAGLLSLTQSLRAEFRDKGISASAICPGFANQGGMYELIKQETGRRTPWYMGSTSSKAVARATLRAIRKDLPEVIVNQPPLRPVFALAALAPGLGSWCIRKASFRFLQRVATARSVKSTSGIGSTG